MEQWPTIISALIGGLLAVIIAVLASVRVAQAEAQRIIKEDLAARDEMRARLLKAEIEVRLLEELRKLKGGCQ